jgi:hypothetical protein
MPDHQSPLDRLTIASPCAVSWDAMSGDDRVRSCAQCRLNVYNLSAMTRPEAETLIAQKEGRACVRFYRRADGTVLTQDCPVGLAAVRRKLRRLAGAAAALLACLIGGGSWLKSRQDFKNAFGAQPLMGMISTPIMGEASEPHVLMGKPARVVRP